MSLNIGVQVKCDEHKNCHAIEMWSCNNCNVQPKKTSILEYDVFETLDQNVHSKLETSRHKVCSKSSSCKCKQNVTSGKII